MLGAIFFKAQNKIQDPAKLSRLVQLIDAESWISLDADTKGDLYEGLLQKNAEDTKSGAGQYFTPRALIEAMVACVRPEPMKAIADPACGTGGFFLGAYSWLTRPGTTLDKRQKAFLRDQTFHGNEIVPGTRRMCLMNLFLHNIGELDGEPSVERSDGRVHTKGVWFYDLRTNKHFTLKTRTLKLDDLQDFITCYHPENRHERMATDRFKFFSYDELMARDKASLDIFWLKDDSLDNLDDLPPPEVLQQEIIEHLEAALAAFRDVAVGLPRQGAATP